MHPPLIPQSTNKYELRRGWPGWYHNNWTTKDLPWEERTMEMAMKGDLREVEDEYLNKKYSPGRIDGDWGPTSLAGTMRALSWNCRGVGYPQIVGAIWKLITHQIPNLVFLMETKKKVGEINFLRNLGFLKHSFNGLTVGTMERLGQVIWFSYENIHLR